MCVNYQNKEVCSNCIAKSYYRKSWKYLTDDEVEKIKEGCRLCKYVWVKDDNKHYINGCNYLDIVGHSRGCDPRDCKKLGFYQPGSRIKVKVTNDGVKKIHDSNM